MKVGIDIVKIGRFSRLIEDYGERFLRRVFTEREIEECMGRKRNIECLAGRFAVKEAVIKTLGGGFLYRKIEVLRSEGGRPHVDVKLNLPYRWDVSISHDGEVAVAIALMFVDNK